MAREMISRLHPDLKLGLVLVSAAVLFNVVGWATFAVQRYAPLGFSFNWVVWAGTIGGLAVIPVAVWVDRRPPHTMMAAGAVVVATGLTTIVFSNGVVAAAVGMFIAGVGGAAVGLVVFCAIAAKGSLRYKGTIIGAVSMVFALHLDGWAFREWSDHSPTPVLGIGVGLILAGGVILLRFLPRVFTQSYGPGTTLLRELAVPRVRRAVVWVAAAYLIAYMGSFTIVIAPSVALNSTILSVPGLEGVRLHDQAMPLAIGISALVWGIASDFYPARRLVFIAGLMLLAVAVALAAIDGFSTSAAGVLARGFVRGALLCLPWVLMAELLPTRHFAKIAVGITVILGPLAWIPGPILLGGLADDLVPNAHFWSIPALGIALTLVAARLPRPPLPPPQNHAHLPNA